MLSKREPEKPWGFMQQVRIAARRKYLPEEKACIVWSCSVGKWGVKDMYVVSVNETLLAEVFNPTN